MDEPDTALPLHPVAGVRLGVASAQALRQDRTDLTVIAIEDGALLQAIFTRNAFAAAPVTIARRHLALASPRYCVINAGNANAGTGEAGLENCRKVCATLAHARRCPVEAVLPFSTGVIGEPLPVSQICKTLPACLQSLEEAGWKKAARSIMTTDRAPKGYSEKLTLGGTEITVTGIAKGAGMICPDMATMLAFIATDAHIEKKLLGHMLQRAAGKTFNRITVDGDTSTNDAAVLIATARGGGPEIRRWDRNSERIAAAITRTCEHLALAIVEDGEGATRIIDIRIEGGRDEQECLRVAYLIAHSPLFKTACHGGSPNWGRILAAVGRSGLNALDIGQVNLFLGDLPVVEQGSLSPRYNEAKAKQFMAQKHLRFVIHLGRGRTAAKISTCDLSRDYIRINEEYLA